MVKEKEHRIDSSCANSRLFLTSACRSVSSIITPPDAPAAVMLSSLVSRLVILSLGTLYPAFASYKAVRTKNVPEYVRWMMYWIVFALFTCAEAVADLLVAWWLPLYYELKMALVVWLLARGSSVLYRGCVHPWLERHEAEIERWTAAAARHGCRALVRLGASGLNVATQVVVQTAVRGGGGLVTHIQRSYSTSDVTDAARPAPAVRATWPAIPEVPLDPQPVVRRRRKSPARLRPRPVSESVIHSASAAEPAQAAWEAVRSMEDVRESPEPPRRRTHPAGGDAAAGRARSASRTSGQEAPRTRSRRAAAAKSPSRARVKSPSRKKSPARTKSESRRKT